MEGPKGFYSPDEVAELLGLHVRTVRRYIREGRLGAKRIGKQYRIAAAELSDFLGAEATRPQQPQISRSRRVIVSSIVDIDAISREESDRLIRPLTAVFNTARGSSGSTRVDCIYYEEQGRLRIRINADPSYTSSMLSMIDGILEDGRRE